MNQAKGRQWKIEVGNITTTHSLFDIFLLAPHLFNYTQFTNFTYYHYKILRSFQHLKIKQIQPFFSGPFLVVFLNKNNSYSDNRFLI
jgi:hypothetical protein